MYGISQSVPGGPFSAPIVIGGVGGDQMAGDPVAIRTPGGVIAIYSADSRGELLGISQSQAYGPFGQWQLLSPPLYLTSLRFDGSPAVLLTATGVIAIYARDYNSSTIWGISQSKAFGPFSAWVQIGTPGGVALTGDPDPPFAMFTSTHVIAIYAADRNSQIAGVSQNVPTARSGHGRNSANPQGWLRSAPERGHSRARRAGGSSRQARRWPSGRAWQHCRTSGRRASHAQGSWSDAGEKTVYRRRVAVSLGLHHSLNICAAGLLGAHVDALAELDATVRGHGHCDALLAGSVLTHA